MNSTSSDCVRGWCSFNGGPRDEFTFPRDVIEASATGGREEVFVFMNRLEVARQEVNLDPEFKAFFAKAFQPLVFEMAFHFVAREAALILMQRLSAARDEAVLGLRSSCEKFPYLKIVSESQDRLAIQVVPEAISIEAMALEVKEIIGPPLEQICSRYDMAEWGMSHILAWSLEDLAHQEHFLQELAKVSPRQADVLIWNRTWGGDEFPNRYAYAVESLACAIAEFVLEAADLESKDIRWAETLIGLRSPRYYLEIACQADHSGNAVLDWATTKYAGLLRSDVLAVAETLRSGVWRNFSDERARRQFVFKEARRRNQEMDLAVLSSLGGLPGLQPFCVDDWHRCGYQALAMGKDSIIYDDEPDFSKVSTGSGQFKVIEALISLKRAASSVLSLDAQRVLYARLQDHTRAEMHIALGMPKKRVAAAWKELYRAKSRFYRVMLGNRKMLSPSFPQTGIL